MPIIIQDIIEIDIWANNELSKGEKILQTVIALANVLQGVASSFSLVSSVAKILTAITENNKRKTDESTRALGRHQEEVVKNDLAYRELNREVGNAKTIQKGVKNTINDIILFKYLYFF